MALRRIELGKPRAFIARDDDALDIPDPPAPENFLTEDGPARLKRADADYAEALKRFESAYQRARESGNLADYPLREGARPTVFWIASLTVGQVQRLESMSRVAQADFGAYMSEVLSLGIAQIEHFIEVRPDADGSLMEHSVTVGQEESPEGPRLKKAGLALLTDPMLRLILSGEVDQARRLSPVQRKSR